MSKEKSFLKECSIFAKEIIDSKSNNFPFYIFSHYDPDGITAASIISAALSRENLPFHVQIMKGLEVEKLNNLNQELPSNSTVLFLDLGTGVINAFSTWLEDKTVFILDHHSLENDTEIPIGIRLLNPHLFSIDGNSEISGAGITYLVAKEINSKNKTLSYLGTIGALGDHQDTGENSALTGLNRMILEDAIELGLITEENSVWFYDRSRSIVQVLRSTNLVNFEGDLEILNFLREIEIPTKKDGHERIFYDLSTEECMRLASKLIELGVDQNEIIKKDYQLVKERIVELKDARVFATKLNSCGRLGRADIGISLCLGDRTTALRELKIIAQEDKKLLSEYLRFIDSTDKLKELTNLYVLDGTPKIDENFIGRITSIISYREDLEAKPILGIAKASNDKLKLSMRRTKALKDNIDLSEILREIIHEIEPKTEVGGHRAAAGAMILEKSLNLVITNLNKRIENKLKGERNK
ncbi:MAG: DHH family phosphoesterase [Candidatus Hodarchaeales archaeon]